MLHPVFNVGMAGIFVRCRLEYAITTRFFAALLIWYCLNEPKPDHEELTRWCGEVGPGMSRPPNPPAWVLRERG